MSTAAPVPTRRRLGGARVRILGSFLVLLLVSDVVSVVIGQRVLTSRARERVSASLAQEVDEFRALVADGRNPRTGRPYGGDLGSLYRDFLARNVPSPGEAVFTYRDGQPFNSTVGTPRSPALRRTLSRLGEVRDVRRGEVETRDGPVAYVAVPVRVGDRRRGTFVVTANVADGLQEAVDVSRITAGIGIAVLLLAGGVAFVLTGRVLRPLRDLTDTAQQISETDLTRRIDVRGADEIAELGHTFNAMLSRLEDAFASQRAFVSDAGHELRTPITIIRGHLELMGDEPRERAETLELVDDELARMSRLVEDLLTLAKSERPDFLLLEDVDLDVLTEELFAKARALDDRDWRLVAVGAGVLAADPQRLTQAVMNLAANAAQHTRRGDTIELGSAVEGDRARLWVRDRGPGVPLAEQQRIFERFARGRGSARSEGAGLGLAIAKAVAEAHGGDVGLRSPPGAGAEFSVRVAIDRETAEHPVLTARPPADGRAREPRGPRRPRAPSPPHDADRHDDPTREIHR